MEDKELKKLAKDIFEKIKKKYYETAKEMIVANASVNTSKEIKITDSKIEGIPYIPKGSKIPTNSEGKQFMFLAQINCADLKGLEVIYYEKIGEYFSEDEFKKMYNPYKYDPAWDFLIAHHPCKMEFSLGKQKENLDYDFLDILFEKVWEEENFKFDEKDKLSEEVEEIYGYEFYEENIGTKCNGFPFFTQSEPRKGDEINEYDTLLFQINSGKEIMIGDCGVMNFFINREKLKNKDFSDVFYNWDCY